MKTTDRERPLAFPLIVATFGAFALAAVCTFGPALLDAIRGFQ